MELQSQLGQQQIEFLQQLKQKDEYIQAVQMSLQQQVDELRCQLQQKDQQIADIRDQLLQKGEQLAAVHQNMETKQQMITSLERQLKEEAEQLTQVEVELAENAQQFERRLQHRDQQLAIYEERLHGIKRKQLEERQEVGRQVAEVDRKIQEANTKFLQDSNQTLIEVADLRMRLGQVETSLREEQGGVDMQLKKKSGELMSMAESVDWRRRVPVHIGGQTGEEYTDPQERTKRKEHDQLGMTRKKEFQ